MAQYTIDDIEILRKKSGVSYEEAVNLLEYHNGSLARALVDLEKNGRIRQEKHTAESARGVKGVLDSLYRMRLVVTKKDVTILNFSILFVIVSAVMAPYLCIVGLVISLVLGYHIAIRRNSPEFAQDSLQDMVHNATKNVQQSVRSFAQQFSGDSGAAKQDSADSVKPEQAARSESAPSNTRPVNVQFPGDGNVGVHDDGDGYHEADIQ